MSLDVAISSIVNQTIFLLFIIFFTSIIAHIRDNTSVITMGIEIHCTSITMHHTVTAAIPSNFLSMHKVNVSHSTRT